MDKAAVIKQEIEQLVTSYLGAETGKTFANFYLDETLPVYAQEAFNILKGFIGAEKAKAELHAIFLRNHAEHAYV